MARTVTAHMFSSVNGVPEAPDQFQFDAFGQVEGELMGKALAGVTDVIIRRTLWQEWSEYWPPMEGNDPFAEFINPVRKPLVSTSLTGGLGWTGVLVAMQECGTAPVFTPED